MEKQIGLFKLVTGEEIIAEYEVNEFFYTFKAPRKVFIAQTGPKEFGVKLMAWMLGNPDGEFPVAAAHVVTPTEQMTELLRNGYLKETSPIDLSATAPTTLVTP